MKLDQLSTPVLLLWPSVLPTAPILLPANCGRSGENYFGAADAFRHRVGRGALCAVSLSAGFAHLVLCDPLVFVTSPPQALDAQVDPTGTTAIPALVGVVA